MLIKGRLINQVLHKELTANRQICNNIACMTEDEGSINQQDIWHIPFDQRSLELFTLPFTTYYEEQRLLDQFSKETVEKYHIGLVIGRFQPLHYGHIFLMKQALQIADAIIVGIGSSNVRNADNPFSAEQREKMLQSALERDTDIRQRILKIVHVKDYADDTFWLKETLKAVGEEVDIVVGNNDWVNGIFEHANYPALKTPLYNRNRYEGKKIREYLRNPTKRSNKQF